MFHVNGNLIPQLFTEFSLGFCRLPRSIRFRLLRLRLRLLLPFRFNSLRLLLSGFTSHE